MITINFGMPPGTILFLFVFVYSRLCREVCMVQTLAVSLGPRFWPNCSQKLSTFLCPFSSMLKSEIRTGNFAYFYKVVFGCHQRGCDGTALGSALFGWKDAGGEDVPCSNIQCRRRATPSVTPRCYAYI